MLSEINRVIGRLGWVRRRVAGTWQAAGAIRPRGAFLRREARRRSCVGEYAPRRSGLKIALRHPMVDFPLVREVFVADEYAFPERVLRLLTGLDRPARVLDVGGNIGLFALRAHEQLPGAHVVSFEPDPRNLDVLRRCAALNPELSWEIVPAAAGRSDGRATFISDFACGRLADVAELWGGHVSPRSWLPRRVRHIHPAVDTVEVEIRDVFPYMGGCDLLKIDVEGAEWDLLADPRFGETSALAVVIEVHPLPDSPSADLLDDAFRRAGLTWSGVADDLRAGYLVWAWRE